MQLFLMAACFPVQASSAAQLPPAPAFELTVTNLGVAGFGVVSDDLALYEVYEARQGDDFTGQDFNGDDDAGDRVLHVRDLRTGATTNTKLATLGVAQASKELIVFVVDEREQGDADRNGDGDTNDVVLHVIERSSGRLFDLGLATSEPLLSGDLVAFAVHEFSQGDTDLNGDGDANDRVVHVLRAGQPAKNLGLALPQFFTTSPPMRMSLEGELLGFLVGEDEQGVDLNSDGTLGDSVMHVYDGSTDTLHALGLALGTSSFDDHLWHASSTSILFGVNETAQGGIQLNGDTDLNDIVPHVWRADTATVRNLGLASVGFFFHRGYVQGEDFGAFLVAELTQGNANLNGDNDREDVVAFVYDERSDSVHSTGLGVKRLALNQDPVWAATGRRLVFQVSEAAQRVDLNGDGDIGNDGERVLHVHEVDSRVTTNARLAVFDALAAGDSLAFRVAELFQGNQDLNGDGVANDGVLHFRNLRTGTTVSSGAAADTNYTVVPGLVLFTGNEFLERVDLNGDADTGDDVVRIFSPASANEQNLGLAVPRIGPFSLDGHLSPRRVAFVTVPEDDQGFTDLNGDGDIRFDAVLHLIEVRERARLR